MEKDKFDSQNKKELKYNLFIIMLVFIICFLAAPLLSDIFSGVYSKLSIGWRHIVESYVSFIFSLILIIMYIYFFHRNIFNSIWSRDKVLANSKSFLLGLLYGLVLNCVCVMIAIWTNSLSIGFSNFNFIYLLIAFLACIIQCATEEIIMRGYLYQVLTEKYNILVGIMLPSFIFGLMHLTDGATIWSFVGIVAFGVAMSLIVYRTDSLWIPIGIHTAWNFMQNFIFGLPNSGIQAHNSMFVPITSKTNIFYNTIFGVESSISMVVCYLLICVVIFLELRKKSSS